MMTNLPNEAEDYSPDDLVDLLVPSALAGERLDAALAQLLPAHSRSRLQTWIKAGRVLVDGAACAETKCKVHGGESIVVCPEEDPLAVASQPEAIPLQVVFEDDTILVIDKPAGLVVHPGSGNWSGTLLNALLHHHPAAAAIPRAGIVHRLDKDTSGLLVVAKTLTAQTDLVRQLQARTVKREYLAVVAGVLPRDGTVETNIGRHPTQRTKMAVVQGGKPAITRYKVLERLSQATVVECSLETGRTHQIRVHMAHLGHPLIGDPVYGDRRTRAVSVQFARQALHARRLGLLHPVSGQAMHFEAPVPEDLAMLIETLRHV